MNCKIQQYLINLMPIKMEDAAILRYFFFEIRIGGLCTYIAAKSLNRFEIMVVDPFYIEKNLSASMFPTEITHSLWRNFWVFSEKGSVSILLWNSCYQQWIFFIPIQSDLDLISYPWMCADRDLTWSHFCVTNWLFCILNPRSGYIRIELYLLILCPVISDVKL